MKKKFSFILPLVLSVLLLVGCRDLSSSNNGSSELPKVEIFGDALPSLSDPLTWPTPAHTHFTSSANFDGMMHRHKLANNIDEFKHPEAAISMMSNAVLIGDFNVYQDGFKADMTATIQQQTFEGNIYTYHDDGMTYKYAFLPEIYEDDDDEDETEPTWEAEEDPELEYYNFELEMMLESYVHPG